MQQLLQLKTEEPQDVVSAESLFDPDQLNERFGGRFTELRDLLSTLFTSSFLFELKEETKSLDIILDEEEKKIILKLKKKTKSKSLVKKGQVYALRKELRMTSLTLVYNLQPHYGMLNELQPITPIEPMINVVKPLEVSEPKTMMSDTLKLPIKPPILIDNSDNITIVLPLSRYTENLLQELPNKTYEQKFKSFASDTYLEIENALNTDNYHLGPEKVIRPEELLQQYKPDLIVQNPTQNFERQSGEIQVIKYDRPKLENGEFIYQEIRMRATRPTTVYDLLKQSGLPFKATYNKEFNGIYVSSMNGIREGSYYWEAKINGQYAPTSFDKAIVKPGDDVTFVLKTSRGVCGEPVAG